MSQTPLPAPAARGAFYCTLAERLILLRQLDGATPKTLEATRAQSTAYDELVAGISPADRANGVDLSSDAAKAVSACEISRSTAHTLIELVKSVIAEGKSPGLIARPLLAAHDKLIVFVSES